MAEAHKVVIIGAGPAGYTAAIYAGRANLEPVLYAGLQPGGQLTITSDVENYPPFPEGILGPELMERFRTHAARFAKEIVDTEVTKVDFSKRPFAVTYEGGEALAQSVIIATGASARWLGLPSERMLRGRGVSACATCDGFFFRGKEIAVVGGGDTAMEEATFLTKFATRVHLIHRRESFRASKIMQDRALGNSKINPVLNSTVDEVLGSVEAGVTGVRLRNVQTGATTELAIHGFFVAIGHDPNTALFRGQLDMDDSGYIKTLPGTTRTSVPGVFACGDVQDSVYRQAVTAAGSGCMAAIDAERWLQH
jgi:thioredoxin reductase (NADPH)